MPTPLVYDSILYVIANNGVFDAYDPEDRRGDLPPAAEPVGSGFSASPVAADGRIYLSSEDGDIIVIAAGREFKQLAVNPMGDLVMATPALSDGVMYVRSASSLFAIGKKDRAEGAETDAQVRTRGECVSDAEGAGGPSLATVVA